MTTDRIFVVDDDKSTRQIITGILESTYRVFQADSEAELFRQLPQNMPDLFLLDVVLPGSSGIDICRKIVASDAYRHIPVILVTVKSDEQDVQDGLAAGAVDYVKKPIRALELFARVKSALKMSHLVKQLRTADMEKQRLIDDLEAALKEVKQLSGLLPICSQCKNIRDDNGYWQRIEKYISSHSDAQFSHGMCPKCFKKLYGNESWYPGDLK